MARLFNIFSKRLIGLSAFQGMVEIANDLGLFLHWHGYFILSTKILAQRQTIRRFFPTKDVFLQSFYKGQFEACQIASIAP